LKANSFGIAKIFLWKMPFVEKVQITSETVTDGQLRNENADILWTMAPSPAGRQTIQTFCVRAKTIA
jgi:hypothetical protein